MSDRWGDTQRDRDQLDAWIERADDWYDPPWNCPRPGCPCPEDPDAHDTLVDEDQWGREVLVATCPIPRDEDD